MHFDSMGNMLREFHKHRRLNKSKWLFFHATVGGEPVAIKSYNTWVQVAEFRGLRDGGPMDCSVKQMTDWLVEFFSY